MDYLLFAFGCKFVTELIFKSAKLAHKHLKAKKKSSAPTLDNK